MSWLRTWWARLDPLPKALIIVGSITLVPLVVIETLVSLGGDTPPPNRPAPVVAREPTDRAMSPSPLRSTASSLPRPTETPPSSTVLAVGVTGPGYVVAHVFMDDPTVSLVVSPPNETAARAAIKHYVRHHAGNLSYLFIETLADEDAGNSICSAEYMTSPKKDRVFDNKPLPDSYPGTIVVCFGSVGGGGDGDTVYFENCTEARDAGAAPLYRGDPGYRPALDRDADGVACE